MTSSAYSQTYCESVLDDFPMGLITAMSACNEMDDEAIASHFRSQPLEFRRILVRKGLVEGTYYGKHMLTPLGKACMAVIRGDDPSEFTGAGEGVPTAPAQTSGEAGLSPAQVEDLRRHFRKLVLSFVWPNGSDRDQALDAIGEIIDLSPSACIDSITT